MYNNYAPVPECKPQRPLIQHVCGNNTDQIMLSTNCCDWKKRRHTCQECGWTRTGSQLDWERKHPKLAMFYWLF